MKKIIFFLIIVMVFVSGCDIQEYIPFAPVDKTNIIEEMGYHPECYNTTVVEEYKVIDKTEIRDYCNEKCVVEEGGDGWTSTYLDATCLKECKTQEIPFIIKWNETICTKEILVRDV